MQYDLVITGGHVLDPARGIDRITNVAVADGKIAAVGEQVDATQAKQTLDASGQYVTPGWFDMHVHAYSHLAFSHPDTIGVLQGVPTMLDAGGAGAWTYDDCRSLLGGAVQDGHLRVRDVTTPPASTPARGPSSTWRRTTSWRYRWRSGRTSSGATATG